MTPPDVPVLDAPKPIDFSERSKEILDNLYGIFRRTEIEYRVYLDTIKDLDVQVKLDVWESIREFAPKPDAATIDRLKSQPDGVIVSYPDYKAKSHADSWYAIKWVLVLFVAACAVLGLLQFVGAFK